MPCEFVGRRVSTRLYPRRVEVAIDADIVARQQRTSDEGHVNYDWQHYIELVQRKPSALGNGAPFADISALLQRLSLGLPRGEGGTG